MGSIQTEEQTVTGYAAKDESGFLSPFRFNLRNTGAEDVVLKVMYCGICHTDLHLIKNDLHYSQYPMVPGHEVVGEVTEVGWEVRKFKVGDKVGVGCICGSCNSCSSCKANIEQYCNKRIWSYNDVYHDGRTTYGGFANSMVVNQKFVVHVPVNLPLEEVAPLLCAGVTIYSPLRHYGYIKPGLRGAILGLGGVGHVGVLMAKAMGHHVTVISSSEKKKVEALKNLGADEYLVSSDAKKMQVMAESFDYIIDTIPAMHALEPYLPLLKVNGNLIIVGVVPAPMQFFSHMIGLSRRSISGSFIGNMEEIQEMLNFCGEKQVKSIVEVVKLDYINKAMERLEKNDVRYRFVVDVANSNLP